MADKKIREIFTLKKVDGEIGIEIEMEGNGLNIDTPSWRQHEDGSLRGNNVEYVLYTPLKREKIKAALMELEDGWRKYGSSPNPSNRCGVHVHLNCQNKTLKDVEKIMALYYCFEDVLLKYCGDERDGNFFCLGSRHAEWQLTNMIDMVVEQKLGHGQVDQHYRYAALNITSLAKFGSLEFRPLKTTKSMAPVLDWVNIILCLNDKAEKYESTRDIVESCSAAGATRFTKEIFGLYAEQLACKNMDKMVMDGVRRVQEFAYAPLIVEKKKEKQLKGFEVQFQPGEIRIIDDAGQAVNVAQWWDLPPAAGNAQAPEPRQRRAAVANPPIKPPLPADLVAELDQLKANSRAADNDIQRIGVEEADRIWAIWNNRKEQLSELFTMPEGHN